MKGVKRFVRVPTHLIAELGKKRAIEKSRFIIGELQRAGLPVTDEGILVWLEYIAEREETA